MEKSNNIQMLDNFCKKLELKSMNLICENVGDTIKFFRVRVYKSKDFDSKFGFTNACYVIERLYNTIDEFIDEIKKGKFKKFLDMYDSEGRHIGR